MGSEMGPYLPRRPVAATAGAALTGAGLLIASAAIHLDLYLTGYRTIAVIGWLFLFQVIVMFALAGLVLATLGRVAGLACQLAAVAGALFALATLGGYLLALRISLFGFREVQTTAGLVAGLVEIAAFCALAYVAMPLFSLGRLREIRRTVVSGAGAVAVIAVVLLAADYASAPSGSAGTGSAQPGGQVQLRTGKAGGATVLTNDQGRTLYWFAPDTSSTSKCYGACAAYWPPVIGKPSAGSGVTGRLGTISRTDGTQQATYDGHPLYTYVSDTGPGMASGNKVKLNGGFWYEVTP